jgi:hypothetical protein
VEAYEINCQHMYDWIAERGSGEVEQALNQLEDLTGLLCRHDGEVISNGPAFNHVWRSADACLVYLYTWQQEILRALLQSAGPAVFDPAWLKWCEGVVLSLADTCHTDEAFRCLPILADALEEAGCSHPGLLSHCRQPREHSPRCWVVELLLVGSGRRIRGLKG